MRLPSAERDELEDPLSAPKSFWKKLRLSCSGAAVFGAAALFCNWVSLICGFASAGAERVMVESGRRAAGEGNSAFGANDISMDPAGRLGGSGAKLSVDTTEGEAETTGAVTSGAKAAGGCAAALVAATIGCSGAERGVVVEGVSMMVLREGGRGTEPGVTLGAIAIRAGAALAGAGGGGIGLCTAATGTLAARAGGSVNLASAIERWCPTGSAGIDAAA